MTNAELQAAIAAWLNRSDLTATIPTFVALAEARLARLVQSRQTVTLPVSIAANDQTAPLPANLIDLQSVTITTPGFQEPLAVVAYSAVEAWRQRSPNVGTPRVVAVVGQTLHFAPVSDAAYDLAIQAQEPLVPLTLPTDTTWLLTAHPDSYLFAALAESAPYLKDDERIAVWEGRFQAAIMEIDAARDRSLWPAPLIRPMPSTFAF